MNKKPNLFNQVIISSIEDYKNKIETLTKQKERLIRRDKKHREEIKRLTELSKATMLSNAKKSDEIERLTNIINEIENFIRSRIKDRQEEKQDFEEDLKVCDYEVRETNYNEIIIRQSEITELEDILDKLQELKGSDK